MTFVEEAGVCVCNPNAIPVEGGCQPCAADEVPSAEGMCVKKPASDGATTTAVASGPDAEARQ